MSLQALSLLLMLVYSQGLLACFWLPVLVKLQDVCVSQSVSACAVPELLEPVQNQEYPTNITRYT